MTEKLVKEVRFDLLTNLDDPKIVVRLLNARKSLLDKNCVVYIKGTRARAGWPYSFVLNGGYQYFPGATIGANSEIVITRIDKYIKSGVPLRIRSWGNEAPALPDLYSSVEVVITGFAKHTCEKVEELHTVDLTRYVEMFS